MSTPFTLTHPTHQRLSYLCMSLTDSEFTLALCLAARGYVTRTATAFDDQPQSQTHNPLIRVVAEVYDPRAHTTAEVICYPWQSTCVNMCTLCKNAYECHHIAAVIITETCAAYSLQPSEYLDHYHINVPRTIPPAVPLDTTTTSVELSFDDDILELDPVVAFLNTFDPLSLRRLIDDARAQVPELEKWLGEQATLASGDTKEINTLMQTKLKQTKAAIRTATNEAEAITQFCALTKQLAAFGHEKTVFKHVRGLMEYCTPDKLLAQKHLFTQVQETFLDLIPKQKMRALSLPKWLLKQQLASNDTWLDLADFLPYFTEKDLEHYSEEFHTIFAAKTDSSPYVNYTLIKLARTLYRIEGKWEDALRVLIDWQRYAEAIDLIFSQDFPVELRNTYYKILDSHAHFQSTWFRLPSQTVFDTFQRLYTSHQLEEAARYLSLRFLYTDVPEALLLFQVVRAKASHTPYEQTIKELYEALITKTASQYTLLSGSRLAPVCFNSPQKIVAITKENATRTNEIISRELLIWLTLLDPDKGVKLGLEQASLYLLDPNRRTYQLTSAMLQTLAHIVLIHNPSKESTAWDLLAHGVSDLRKQYSNRSSLKSYLNEYLADLGL